MDAAEDFASLLHAVTDDPALAVRANRRQRVDRALEAIEGVVGFDRPDGAERVSPSSDQRPLRAGRIRRARIQEQEKNASQKNSQRRLCFHGAHPVS